MRDFTSKESAIHLWQICLNTSARFFSRFCMCPSSHAEEGRVTRQQQAEAGLTQLKIAGLFQISSQAWKSSRKEKLNKSSHLHPSRSSLCLPTDTLNQLREIAETLPRPWILLLLPTLREQCSYLELTDRVVRAAFWSPLSPIRDLNMTLKSLALADQAQVRNTHAGRVTGPRKVTTRSPHSRAGFGTPRLSQELSSGNNCAKACSRAIWNP